MKIRQPLESALGDYFPILSQVVSFNTQQRGLLKPQCKQTFKLDQGHYVGPKCNTFYGIRGLSLNCNWVLAGQEYKALTIWGSMAAKFGADIYFGKTESIQLGLFSGVYLSRPSWAQKPRGLHPQHIRVGHI